VTVVWSRAVCEHVKYITHATRGDLYYAPTKFGKNPSKISEHHVGATFVRARSYTHVRTLALEHAHVRYINMNRTYHMQLVDSYHVPSEIGDTQSKHKRTHTCARLARMRERARTHNLSMICVMIHITFSPSFH
jgi:hypothetical protein